MTSLSKFKRQQKNKPDYSNESKSKVSIKFQQTPSRVSSNAYNASNVWVMPENVIFSYENPYQQILKSQITINNQTGDRIYFQFTPGSSNRISYRIQPLEEVLNNQKAIEIKITLSRNNKNISAFEFDCFQLSWGFLPNKPGAPLTMTNTITIQSRFIHTQNENRFTLGKNLQNKNVQIKPPSSIFKTLRPQPEEQEQPVFYDAQSPNKRELIRQQFQLQRRISQRESNNHQKTRQRGPTQQKTLLTKFNMILVAVISFLVGFIAT